MPVKAAKNAKRPPGFPCRLHLARERAGLSVPQLAQRVGMSRQQLYDLEAGRKAPLLATAIALAKALGVPLTDFE